MVDNEKILEEEKKVKKIVDEFNDRLLKEIDGRPYLLVVATLFELERQKDSSKIAGQWNWRTNMDPQLEKRGKDAHESGKKMLQLLIGQVEDAIDRKEIGVKDRYKLR